MNDFFKDIKNPTMNELIYWFMVQHTKLVDEMQESYHALSTDKPNSYHTGDNSVWTHTMMVCLNAQKAHKINKITALLHDIGKPLAREIIGPKESKPASVSSKESKPTGKTRVHFRGHEGISFWKAIDPLYDLLQKEVINKEEMQEILEIISLHGTLFERMKNGKEFKPNEIVKKFKTLEKYTRFVNQVKFDTEGRFYMGNSERHEAEIGVDVYTEKTFNDNISIIEKEKKKNNIIILIGLPAGGKSTYLNNRIYTPENAPKIISRDNVLMEYAKDLDMEYSEVFKTLTKEDHIQIDKLVQKEFNEAIKNNKNIIVDMTNMSKRSRRKWLSNTTISKTYNKKAIVFVAGESILEYRNNLRKVTEGKDIPKNVYTAMMKSFTVPTYSEFDSIEYIWN